MAGKGIPHRHVNRKVGRLSDRNVNEVCLYFKELRMHSAARPTLNANIAVKALPEGAKAEGAGSRRDETGAENDEPTLKLDWDPKAKRKPGQVLKLTTTFAELTSPKGAKFGWVDPPGPKTREEALAAIKKSQEEISSRPGVFLRKYKRDSDGKLTTEIEDEVRIKELGRSIGSTMGRVSTQAFQAAGGIIDANGKLRCPPGTPNANQFTDLDMSNCNTIGLGSVIRSVFRVGRRLDAMAERGAEVRQYGRSLTPYEREQQNRFKATKGSAVQSRETTQLADADFNARVDAILEKHGVTADDASSSANADLIQGLHGLFREKYGPGREKEADEAFRRFLFGKSEAEKLQTQDPTLGGGIFADAGLGGEEFIWEGDFSPESIAANTKRYNEMMDKAIAKYIPDEVKPFLTSSDPKEREVAQKYIQAIRERHHAGQREFLKSYMYLQDKYPDAAERVGELRALMPYDLKPDSADERGEDFLDVEGSTTPTFDGFGDIKVPMSFNALGMALRAAQVDEERFKISDDGSIFIDAPGAASEAQKRALLLSALEDISDAMLYAEIVGADGYANDTSAARLQAALGLDPVRGKARHVAFHEFGHVMQYHAVQQNIIDVWERDGKFVIDTPEGLVEFTEPPSTWTNEQWADAVVSLAFRGDNRYKFPPGGAQRFEKSLVNIFAGKRYQSELADAEKEAREGGNPSPVLRKALLEGTAEIFAQRELGILGGPEVDDSIAWMLPENINATKVRDIPYDIPPEVDLVPPTPDSPPVPDVPTNTGPPTAPPGNGGTVININIHAPINIVINNNYGAGESEAEAPQADVAKPRQVDIGWADLAGHMYFDNETQWQPGSTHNLPIEQNPDEISRFVDVAFGLGPEEGGPDPNDPLGEIRQTKDAYWKMTPEQLDARYEKLESEYKKLVEKSKTEPLTADEQARMWLAIKGMRQVLDVNTRKSKLSDEEIEKYKARGFNPQPGRYMRRPDSALNRRKDLRTGPIEKRKLRGYDDIVEVDDDELAHWSREIADHAGDAVGGRDGFDATSRPYTPGKVRNTPGLTSKEKRKLNPNYKPTQEEIESATLTSDPALVGRRKIDEVIERLTPEQKDVIESDEPVEMKPSWLTVGDAVNGDTESLRSAIDASARARQRLNDGAGTMSRPDSKSQDELLENQLRDTVIPTLDILERSTTDTDMSFVAAMELDGDLTPGTKIDHGGPIRGLLIDGQSADGLKFAEPSTAKRVLVTMPAGSRAMHTKNGHDGDTDGILIPPGTLEVMKVDTDGTVVLMPSRQKTKSEVLGDLVDSIDSVEAERGSWADSEKRALKRLLKTEISNTEVPQRTTRGASGDASTRLLQTNRASAIGAKFNESGSSFFGTESTNADAASLIKPTDTSARIGRMVTADQTRAAKAAEISKLVSELEKVRDGNVENEEFWNLFNEVSDQTKQLIFSSTAEELTKTVEEAVFRYHEAFDDRPRVAITPEQLNNLLSEGVLKNIFEDKPGSLAASLQKSFENSNGLSDATPDNLRSQFGYLVHAMSQKEIQDYLDSLPPDGMARSPRFFSEGPEFSQHGEFKAGGKTVELIMVPETARRTAYTRGDIMDGARQATPMLSTDRGEVLAAHVSGKNSGNSEIDNMRETIGILDSVASGTYTAFGTPSTSTRSSRSTSSGPSAEAVIGGGIRTSDIEAIKVDALDLNSHTIDADEIGGRERLKRILQQSDVKGNHDQILDALLSGDTDAIPKDAQHLITPFNRMRLVLGARKAQAEHNARGGQPPLIFGNPDGFDISDIDSFTNLPHIDPDSSPEEKLFQRLRYDSFGAKMRRLSAKRTEVDEQGPYRVYDEGMLRRRNEFYTTGRLSSLGGDSEQRTISATTPDYGPTTGAPGDVVPDGGSTFFPTSPTRRIINTPNGEVDVERYINAQVKQITTVPELSRVGKNGKTRIDTRKSQLIDKLTWDDDIGELIVTWKNGETETYFGFDERLIVLLEETYDDDNILISDVVKHIGSAAKVRTRGGKHGPDSDLNSPIMEQRRSARLRSSRTRTEREIEERVSRSVSDPQFSNMSDDDLVAEWNRNSSGSPREGVIGMNPMIEQDKAKRRVAILQEMRNRGMKDPDGSEMESLTLRITSDLDDGKVPYDGRGRPGLEGSGRPRTPSRRRAPSSGPRGGGSRSQPRQQRAGTRGSRNQKFEGMSDSDILDEWNKNAPYSPESGVIGMNPMIEEDKKLRRVELLAEMRSRGMKDPENSDMESMALSLRESIDITPTRSTSSRTSAREVRGTSGNTSTTPPSKRKVSDIYRDVSELGSPDNNGGLHQLSDEELFAKFGVERSGNMALIDGQEVFVANDLETAAALIAAGYHVELGPDAPSPTLLVEASVTLQKEINEFIKSEKKDMTAVIDTCRLYVGGTNLWCEGGLGTLRADMPQVAGRMRGDDTAAAKAARAGAVKVDWKGGKRDADGNEIELTPEERKRFDELKGKHAKLNKDGTVTPHTFEEGEMEEFYSLVDWNNTEVNLTDEFKDFVKRIALASNPDKNPDEVIYDESGIDPSSLSASQGQINMANTGGMVTSMRNHDHSFKAYMADVHPEIEYGSDEYYDMRDRWLYGKPKPDGSAFAVPLIDGDGRKLSSDGKPIGEGGTQGIISQPWFTSGSIISTSDGYVVDGHHRWASFIAYNESLPERARLKLNSVVIDAPIQDALAIGKAYQEHWGIKPAVLGKETMYEPLDSPESMNIDAKKLHTDALFEEDADGVPLGQRKAREIYKDLYQQKEGFGYVQKIKERSDEGRTPSTRSTRSSRNGGADAGGSAREVIGTRSKTSAKEKAAQKAGTSPEAEAVPTTAAQKRFDEIQRIEQSKRGALHEMGEDELQKLGLSRVEGKTGITDGRPVYKAETPESAVALMALGYNVELGDGAKAKQLKKGIKNFQKEIDSYLELRDDLSDEEKAMYKIDACRMYVPNSNIFCGKNIGTKRMRMPQISGRLKGDDTVGARAAKAGLVKTSWEPRKDLTPEELEKFDKLKKRHPNPKGEYPEGQGPLTEDERKEFYDLVNWKETEVDFVPNFMDHIRRKAGREDIITTKNGVSPDDYTASQSEIQAEKVSGMLNGIDESYSTFLKWSESKGIKRGSKEFFKLRQEWLDGKYDGQIPILDDNGNQVMDKGKPKFAVAWWAKGAIITSNDGYVVDGHHRWAAVHMFNQDLPEGEKLTINTQEIDVGIFDALNLAKSYQNQVGIKEAKLGLEDDYVKDDSIPDMTKDEFDEFVKRTDDNLESNYAEVRDSGAYIPDGAYARTRGGRRTSGLIARERPRTTQDIFDVARSEIASTRSSRSPRAFSDDYPAMAAIGIDPRPSSGPDGEFEDDENRALAEGILRGATKAQQKEMEQIASDAVASVKRQQDEIRSQIVRELGSEQDLDDLLQFDKPIPRSWSDMSDEKRAAITEMLDRMSQIENQTFSDTIDRLVGMSEQRRRVRNANITAAKRVARQDSPGMPSTRSSRTAPRTGTRFASDIALGIGKQIDGEKLTRNLASAFKKGGTSGVLSQLRKTLRNDSSGWVIDYALDEGYITKAQAAFLRKLAKRLFKKAPTGRGSKSSHIEHELVFADLLSPPMTMHKETSWLQK